MSHALATVGTFTHHRTGWNQTEGGGQTPIYEPLDQPYHRWYCDCGVIGGKSKTEDGARASHARHREEQ